jgi:hypothetical protein
VLPEEKHVQTPTIGSKAAGNVEYQRKRKKSKARYARKSRVCKEEKNTKRKKKSSQFDVQLGASERIRPLFKVGVKLLLSRRGEVDVQTVVLVTAETARLCCM